MSDVDLLGLKPACVSGSIFSDIFDISRFKRIFAIILPAALKSDIPRRFSCMDLSPLFLLREKRSDRAPSHVYGNPIGWIKCLKMVVDNFLRGHFCLFFNFRTIYVMNRPSPARPDPTLTVRDRMSRCNGVFFFIIFFTKL